MRRGWPALDSVEVDGWIVRRSAGVTQRANSVLPAGRPRDTADALRRAESLYGDHGLEPVFQIGAAARPDGLDALLAAAGYERRSPTLALVADIRTVLGRLPRRELDRAADLRTAEAPGDDWMDLWWSVDGRGGAEARSVAYRIMTGGPARYATATDERGPAAVGRLAIVDRWAGIYCVAVRPDARRRGLATAVLRCLLERATELGPRHTWLQVLAGNAPARRLYAKAGFVTAARYHYRTRPASAPGEPDEPTAVVLSRRPASHRSSRSG